MTRLTVRFFIDDNEADQYAADLASETDARDIIAACKERLKEMEPLSAEEEAEEAKAWAAPRQAAQRAAGSLKHRRDREREMQRKTTGEEEG